MTRIERLLQQAVREAELVSYRWKLGSVVARGGSVLSRGHVKFRHHSNIHPEFATWHAEMDALRRLPKGS